MPPPKGVCLQYLPIEHVEVGMCIGEALVIADQGAVRFRLPAGHMLASSDIERLQRLHADYVCVTVPDLRSPEEVAAQSEVAARRVKHIFARADLAQPHIAALFERVLQYRSQHS